MKVGSKLVADHVNRFIWLDVSKPFDRPMALEVIEILKKLDGESKNKITFYIRGVGGDMYAFTELGHAVDELKSWIEFVPFGFVRSGCFWITQWGDDCFAVEGTQMIFHRASISFGRNTRMSQVECLKNLDLLKLVDAFQLWSFTRRGHPIKDIVKLLQEEATISTNQAINLRLVSGIYDQNLFNENRQKAELLIKEKYSQ